MNWSLIDTGTFDYAADAWGYTYGAAAEWYQGDWTVRGGMFDLSIVPNSTDLDPHIRAIPVGRRDRAPLRSLGAARQTRGHRISHAAAAWAASTTRSQLAAADRRPGRHRRGPPLQQPRRDQPQPRAADHGGPRRIRARRLGRRRHRTLRIRRHRSHRRGRASRSNGTQWGRPDDTFGLAGVVNGISAAHAGFSQRRRARHPGRRRHAAASRARTDHRDLLRVSRFAHDA